METNIQEKLISLWNWILSLTTNDIASFSSIAGLFLSIILLILVKSIKKKYQKKIRTPETINDLELISSNISIALSDFENKKFDIFNELGKCKSTLNNLYLRAEPDIKKEIKPLIKKLEIKKSYFKQLFGASNLHDFKEEDVYMVYTEINSINELLKQKEKDIRAENV